MKILIIDDEPDVRRIAQLSLSTVGKMDVVTASSAEEGVRAAAVDAPDAILLDVSMPGTDGPTTLRLLHATPSPPASRSSS
jgi:CheY-like chemotaxis protein